MDIEVVRRETRTIPFRHGSETREDSYTVEIYRMSEQNPGVEYVLMEFGLFQFIVDELRHVRLADDRERVTQSAVDGE